MNQESKKYEKITVQASIASGSQRVWEYYTDPEHIKQWNFASPDWQCPRVQNELQVGGSFFARMEAKDGSFGFDYEAVYDEIRPGKYLSSVLTDGRQVQVSFEGEGNQTLVTISFDAETENSRDMQREGWQSILNNFKTHVEES